MNFAPGRLQAVLALHKGLSPAQAWDFTIKKKTISTTEDRGFVLVYGRNRALSLALSECVQGVKVFSPEHTLWTALQEVHQKTLNRPFLLFYTPHGAYQEEKHYFCKRNL